MESNLDECLKSISNQTFKEYEVIIINDGSTDNSLQIIDSYAKKKNNFRHFTITNSGLSTARNFGVKQAKGDFILFVDSDDYVDGEYVSKLYQKAIDDKADIVFCAVTYVSNDGEILHFEEPFNHTRGYSLDLENKKSNLSFEEILSLWPSAWNKIYKKTLFDDISFPDGYIFEDNETFIKLGMKSNIVTYLPIPLYFHRQTSTGRLSQTSDVGVLQIIAIVDRIVSFVRYNNITFETKEFYHYVNRLIYERVYKNYHSLYSILLLDAIKNKLPNFELSSDNALIEKKIRSKQFTLFGTKTNRHDFFDVTLFFGANGMSFPLVNFDEKLNSFLVHPVTNNVTIAKVSGLVLWGNIEFSITVAIEHQEANAIDYKVAFTTENIQNMDDFNETPISKVLFQSRWRTISGQEPRTDSFILNNYSPSCCCFIITRMNKNKSNRYAWFHVKSFDVKTL